LISTIVPVFLLPFCFFSAMSLLER
jgi:hypothetical protein